MKVLEKGNESKGFELEQVCTGRGNGNGGCKARLLVSEKDIFVTASTAHCETDYFYTFKCPECNTKTDIQAKELPEKVKDHAMQKYKRKHC